MEPATTLIPPTPIALPDVGQAARARRLARTLALASRRFAPLTPVAVRGGAEREQRFACACRQLFEELGSTYVKFGQFIASAPGVVGERWPRSSARASIGGRRCRSRPCVRLSSR